MAVLAVVWVGTFAAFPALAEPIDGFTEPYRTIDVASAETGIVVDVFVREGESVVRGQALAMLDTDVLEAQLAIADRVIRSRGKIDAARAEEQLREDRLDKLVQLRAKQIVRQEEVDRARADVAIAKAEVVSAEDELAIRKLEYQKIKVQIERRVVRAPIDGVVSAIHKDEGEHVSVTDPQVVTVVQLDPLLAIFSLSPDQAARMQVDERVTVQPSLDFNPGPTAASSIDGVVEFVAPVTHAESGTVLVKVRLANPDGKYRSGERCWFDLQQQPVSRKIIH